MERRFRARLAFQAYREKAAKEDKAALAKKLAEQPPGQFDCPRRPGSDTMLLRPAEELDHARALEVGIVYFEHLDRLLNAAMTFGRTNPNSFELPRYGGARAAIQ